MATYFLDPDTDSKADWTEVPGGSAFDRLNDGTRQPTAPGTGSDYIESATDGQLCHVLLGTQTLSAETMTTLRLWVYLTTPAGRAVNLDLQDGTVHFAAKTVPAGTAASWVSVTYVGELTQTQIDNLKLSIQAATGTGTATIYAAYVELFTRTDIAQTANNRIMAGRTQTTGLSTGANSFMGGDIFLPVDIGGGRSVILMGDASISAAQFDQKAMGGNLNSPSGTCQMHRGPVIMMDSYDIEAANYTVFSGAAGDDWSYWAETTVNGKLSKRWPYYGMVRSGRLFVVGGIVPYDPVEGSEEAKWVGYCDNFGSNPTNPALWTWTYLTFGRDMGGAGDLGMVEDGSFMYLFSSAGPGNTEKSIYRITPTNFQNLAWEGGDWWTGTGWAKDSRKAVGAGMSQVVSKRRYRERMFNPPLTSGFGGNNPGGGSVHKRADGKYQYAGIFSAPLVGVTPFPFGYALTPGTSPAKMGPATTKFVIPEGETFVYGGLYVPHLTWPGKGANDQVWVYSTNGGVDPNGHDTMDFPRFVKALAVT